MDCALPFSPSGENTQTTPPRPQHFPLTKRKLVATRILWPWILFPRHHVWQRPSHPLASPLATTSDSRPAAASPPWRTPPSPSSTAGSTSPYWTTNSPLDRTFPFLDGAGLHGSVGWPPPPPPQPPSCKKGEKLTICLAPTAYSQSPQISHVQRKTS
jgi:hypothetical protein